MPLSRGKTLLTCTAAGLFLAAFAPASEPIPPDQFRTLHDLIKDNAGKEKWAQIPWMTSLWDARRKAAAEGKPILLWEMDGHPLGCT
jgi:hypothetical protein